MLRPRSTSQGFTHTSVGSLTDDLQKECFKNAKTEEQRAACENDYLGSSELQKQEKEFQALKDSGKLPDMMLQAALDAQGKAVEQCYQLAKNDADRASCKRQEDDLAKLRSEYAAAKKQDEASSSSALLIGGAVAAAALAFFLLK